MTVCLKLISVEGIFQNGNIAFLYDVKTRRTAAPPVLDPLFLNKHSVINDKDISFKFCV